MWFLQSCHTVAVPYNIYIYIHTHTHTYVCVYIYIYIYSGCFTTCGHYCRRWFPRSLWSKKFIQTCVRFWTVTELWAFFNSRTCPRVNRVLRAMHSAWWLIVCGSFNEQLKQFTTERQPVLRLAVAFSKTSFKHRSIQIKDNFTMLTLHLYFKCIMYYAGLLFSSVYCQ